MNRPLSPLLLLLFAMVATGCAQQGSSSQATGELGMLPAAKPADLIPYRFSGGTGTAHYTAKGKDSTCSGTLTLTDTVYVDVKANGDVDPGLLASASIVGSSTCDGDPFELAEDFDLKTGNIKSGKISDVVGVPPTAAIYGSFKLSGAVCDATIHLGRWIAASGGSRVQIDSANISPVKQTLKC